MGGSYRAMQSYAVTSSEGGVKGKRERERERRATCEYRFGFRCLSRRKVYETRNNDKSLQQSTAFEANLLRIDKQEIERDMNSGLCAMLYDAFCPLIGAR